MRILVDYRPALRERTGVGEFVHQLARALVRPTPSAPADDIVLFSSSWKDRPDPGLSREMPGARIVDRRVPVRALAWAWNHAEWPPVEWLAGPCDVAHSQNPLLIPTARAAQVVTIHDLDFLKHPERGRAEVRRDFPRLVRSHAARADAIVVSSRYSAAEVSRQLDIDPGRIHLCSPGPPDWAAEVARQRAGDLGRRILFVGQLGARKNIGALLDAYARLRERVPGAPPLTLAGPPTEASGEWAARAGCAPLAGHVELTGFVAPDRRIALFADARMLVLPSLDEGFGLPVLEAMACGVPVIVSNRGSLPEVAGPAADPVDPGDVDGLADRMEALLDDGRARAAAQRGLAQSARFSWAGAAAAARAAYAAAIEVHARRH